jgi:nicotinamide-nucleotide amidase
VTKAETLLQRALPLSVKIATAESCTGGLIAAAITAVPGSSRVFDRGFVAYSNTAKEGVMGVTSTTLEDFGAVSVEAVREMAEGVLRRSDADMVIAASGISGPGGSEFKPEGRVCFAIARVGETTVTEQHDFGALGRNIVRAATVDHALDMAISVLQDSP